MKSTRRTVRRRPEATAAGYRRFYGGSTTPKTTHQLVGEPSSGLKSLVSALASETLRTQLAAAFQNLQSVLLDPRLAGATTGIGAPIVKNYLLQACKIPTESLSVFFYGESKPGEDYILRGAAKTGDKLVFWQYKVSTKDVAVVLDEWGLISAGEGSATFEIPWEHARAWEK